MDVRRRDPAPVMACLARVESRTAKARRAFLRAGPLPLCGISACPASLERADEFLFAIACIQVL